MEPKLFTIINERYDPTLANLVKSILRLGNVSIEDLKTGIDEQLKAHPVAQLDTRLVMTPSNVEYVGGLFRGYVYLAFNEIVQGRVGDVRYSKNGRQPESFHDLISSIVMPQVRDDDEPKFYIN